MGWDALERDLYLARAKALLDETLRPAVFGPTTALAVSAYHVGGEPVPVAEALRAAYEPFAVGQEWGPLWGTTWFRVQGTVPPQWRGSEVVARITVGLNAGVGFGAEALVFSGEAPLQGLSPSHDFVPVARPATGGEAVDLHVEAAANPMADGSLLHADPQGAPICRLHRAELAVRRLEVHAAVLDLETVVGLLSALPAGDPLGGPLLAALKLCIAAVDPGDPLGSLEAARAALAGVLSRRGAPERHRVLALGHAHIDSAWLWPLRETVRKCARTFATAVSLMEEYPDYHFVCSAAQHHEWMREHYPRLFDSMKKKAAAGQFEPVGSMWVEADCNIPSGESLVRQIVQGKRYFMQHYGVETRDLWLPDVFGYPASLPQIMKLAGIEAFVTQKMSWSKTNRFPHSSFMWQGIDGSRIFSHFPPANTYNGDGSPQQLRASERNFADHGRAGGSLYPFGFGDGGGGPTREMIERLRRSADLEGLPRAAIGSLSEFLDEALAETGDLATWAGELYLEIHRGTYTTQARTKRGNRLAEVALREAEMWSAAASGDPADLTGAWRTLLLHQFHDIIPGSSINWVYRDTEAAHASVLAEAAREADRARRAIASDAEVGSAADPVLVFNSLSHARREVLDIDGEPREVEVPPCGWTVVDRASEQRLGEQGAVEVAADGRRIENGLLRVLLGPDGFITSIFDKEAGREVLPEGGRANVLQLHVDRPVNFDAWDVDRYYRDSLQEVTGLDELRVLAQSPLRCSVRLARSFGASRVEQDIELDAGSRVLRFRTRVDWRERRQLLKVAFPVAVSAPQASYEIQFGHVQRPTYTNTSWDWARFEVCAQRWADLSEPDYGVALLNDCKYGYDIEGSTLRLSLLRGPVNPDPEADIGLHEMTYALMPHTGDLQRGGVIPAAHELNTPLTWLPAQGAPGNEGSVAGDFSLIAVDRPNVVVEAVKRGDDDASALVVRMYEAWGSRGKVRVTPGRPLEQAWLADLLERDLASLPVEGGSVAVDMGPFEIVTLKLR